MVNSEHEKGIKFLGAEEYSSLTPVWPYHKPRVGGGKIRFGIRVHVLVDVWPGGMFHPQGEDLT